MIAAVTGSMPKGSQQRFVEGQSPDETLFYLVVHGVLPADRGIMVTMRLIMSFTLVALTAPAVAQERGPHAVVVVARAQIISGVRISPAQYPDNGSPHERQNGRPLARERSCPENEQGPCRLLIVDMP